MSGQAVNITINVSDGNSAEAVQQVVAQLNAIGPAGEKAGAQAGAGLDKTSEHALSAKENVRLLSEEMGIHVPRAMQSVIANSQMLMGAIGAIGPAMIAIGAIDILTMMGEKAYKFYENFVELKGVISDSDAVIKSFGDSAQSAMQKASDAAEQYIRITQGARAADEYKLGVFQERPIDLSKQYQDDKFKKLPDAVKGNFENITGESVMPKDLDPTISKLKLYQAEQEKILSYWKQTIDLASLDTLGGVPHTAESGMAIGGMKSVLPEQQKRVELGRSLINTLGEEKAAYDAVTKAMGAQIDADKPGTSDQQQAVAKRKETDAALRALDEKALESQLSGIDLLEAQRKYAESEWVEQHGASTRAMADIDAEYHRKEADFTSKQADEAKKKDATIADAQRLFDQEMQQIGKKSDDEQVQGYARIAAEADRTIATIQADYDKLARTAGISAELLEKGQQNAAAETVNVHQNATSQMEQLYARSMQQIAKEEEQAARLMLPEWQQSNMAIEDAWQDRVRAIDEYEDQQLSHVKGNADATVMIEKDANSKRLASDLLLNAQMQKNAAETRDKLASGLSQMFSNPAQFIEKRAMDLAAEMMATDLMAYFKNKGAGSGILQWLFGMGPEMSMSTNPGDQLSSVFGGSHATSTNSGMMLNTAGTTLMDAGNIQLAAANGLLSAATALQSAAATSSFSGGTAGMGSLGGSFSDMPDATGMASGFSGTGTSMDAGGNSIIDASSLMPAGSGESSSITPAMTAAESFGSTAGTVGKWAGAAGGALTAGIGIYSAYENSDPASGMLTGAMGGVEIGSMFGPMGMAVGGIIGGVAGLLAGVFGDQGKGKAEDFDKNTVQPGIAKEIQDFESGRAGYNSASKEIAALLTSAKDQTSSWGSGARSYFSSHIQPEIEVANSTLQQQEKGGRSLVTMSAAQYHTGGWVGDFGDFGTGPGEGFAKLLAEEFVVQPMAARAHAPLLSAINAGNVSYSRTPQAMMPASGGSGATVNLTIKAIDSKDVARWAAAGGGRDLIAALNQAQRQYSGVGRG